MYIAAADRDGLVALNDRRLERYLRAEDSDAEGELERLIVEDVRPVVAGIVSRYTRSGALLRAEDADDVIATINLRLVQKLRDVGRDPSEAIQNLRSYVASLTYHAVSDFLRKRFPERARLKKRIRYMLENDVRFALWTTEAGPVCGLRVWEGSSDVLDDVPALSIPPGRENVATLAAIFDAAGKPLLLDSLTDAAARLWSIADEMHDDEVTGVPASTPPDDERLEAADFARVLWDEIRELRPMQRKALLLNLRYDGDLDIVSVLMLSSIASFGEIAAALEMSERELAAIWKELPFDDLRIAALLGITRQQVINLRKAARNRLSRRLPR
jgi:RNA polymerase sigma factor (sigma-70 family)